jgi:hypothetical protein
MTAALGSTEPCWQAPVRVIASHQLFCFSVFSTTWASFPNVKHAATVWFFLSDGFETLYSRIQKNRNRLLELSLDDSDEGYLRNAGSSPLPHTLTILNSSIARNSLFGFLRLICKACRAMFAPSNHAE